MTQYQVSREVILTDETIIDDNLNGKRVKGALIPASSLVQPTYK